MTVSLAPAPAMAAGTKTHKNEDAYKKKVMECNTYEQTSQKYKDCMAEAEKL